MRYLFILCLLFAQISLAQQVQPLELGEQLEFYSEILGEKRVLNIYLPENYHKDSVRTYPVIYLLDGSMDEDFIHIMGLLQFGSFILDKDDS